MRKRQEPQEPRRCETPCAICARVHRWWRRAAPPSSKRAAPRRLVRGKPGARLGTAPRGPSGRPIQSDNFVVFRHSRKQKQQRVDIGALSVARRRRAGARRGVARRGAGRPLLRERRRERDVRVRERRRDRRRVARRGHASRGRGTRYRRRHREFRNGLGARVRGAVARGGFGVARRGPRWSVSLSFSRRAASALSPTAACSRSGARLGKRLRRAARRARIAPARAATTLALRTCDVGVAAGGFRERSAGPGLETFTHVRTDASFVALVRGFSAETAEANARGAAARATRVAARAFVVTDAEASMHLVPGGGASKPRSSPLRAPRRRARRGRYPKTKTASEKRPSTLATTEAPRRIKATRRARARRRRARTCSVRWPGPCRTRSPLRDGTTAARATESWISWIQDRPFSQSAVRVRPRAARRTSRAAATDARDSRETFFRGLTKKIAKLLSVAARWSGSCPRRSRRRRRTRERPPRSWTKRRRRSRRVTRR